jgi:hypothetical protein
MQKFESLLPGSFFLNSHADVCVKLESEDSERNAVVLKTGLVFGVMDVKEVEFLGVLTFPCLAKHKESYLLQIS